ncbi:hypothetical protein GPJ56_009785 [Histomonas meleagridis]|uniref:uncharacterized protein n=1 Tax=Histomonas meleagridis TaxID=135588 RepID=UPI00355AB822|nr:hypothetical protein GPJ56_009785 [Histomonas meleagridis]KAH0798798.1 hypothetical protein GO595_008663 [Histomonas meleagridis]
MEGIKKQPEPRLRVKFNISGSYDGKPSIDHWGDELAEYDKGIGYFQRKKDADDYPSDEDDLPDVRPPGRPYRV